jgi:hypothetical protein
MRRTRLSLVFMMILGLPSAPVGSVPDCQGEDRDPELERAIEGRDRIRAPAEH